MVDALGHRLRVYDEGPANAPTLVMLHGAPHNSSEFRFNVPALVEAGYRVVIPEHPQALPAVEGPARAHSRVGRPRHRAPVGADGDQDG
jgi:pimeloyl-ACP methyl ester carboxylesterase